MTLLRRWIKRRKTSWLFIIGQRNELQSTLVMSWLLSQHGRIRCFLLIRLKPEHQCFKANAATRELNTSGHQKHEVRQRLQSDVGPMRSGVAWCGPVWLMVTPLFAIMPMYVPYRAIHGDACSTHGSSHRSPTRDVTDSESASESDRIRQFCRNPKSDGYLKSDRDGFKILVSVQLKYYFRK